MIIENHQMNEKLLMDLEGLRQRCRAVDGYELPIHKHLIRHHRPGSLNLLYYQADRLIGYLSLFFFRAETCEIVLMVEPMYRQQGIAKELLERAEWFNRYKKNKQYIFPIIRSPSMAWLNTEHLSYLHTEYEMQRNSLKKLAHSSKMLKIRKAKDSDLDFINELNRACFVEYREEDILHFGKLMHDPSYLILLSELEGEVVGKAHIRFEEDHAFLSDIATAPKFQRRGFAENLIVYSINHILDCHTMKIRLHVEASNEQALNLYRKCGFEISNACNFYAQPLFP